MTYGGEYPPTVRFDATPAGQEALPGGVFASDAAASGITEVRDLFHPGSPKSEGSVKESHYLMSLIRTYMNKKLTREMRAYRRCKITRT